MYISARARVDDGTAETSPAGLLVKSVHRDTGNRSMTRVSTSQEVVRIPCCRTARMDPQVKGLEKSSSSPLRGKLDCFMHIFIFVAIIIIFSIYTSSES